MESLVDTAAYMIDELLDFPSDVGEDDPSLSILTADNTTNSSSRTLSASFPAECVEEELEWISNKDAFPSVDTFVDPIAISSTGAAGCKFKHRSPVSVLESITNSSGRNLPNTKTIVPHPFGFTASVRRARTTKGKRRHIQQMPCWIKDLQENMKTSHTIKEKKASYNNNTLGRKCEHCQTEKTPQWRAGPNGAKTLCNACGVRYKSGRLVPEYRPANSPTFSSKLHSNSHRKVVEMRRQKESFFGSTGVVAENVIEMRQEATPCGSTGVAVENVVETKTMASISLPLLQKENPGPRRQMEACCGSTTFNVVVEKGAAVSVVENVVEMRRQMEACCGSTFNVVVENGAAASVG